MIKPTNEQTVTEINETRKAAALVVIQLPFKELDAVIDVSLLFLEEDIPTLLSMKNMSQNCSEIAIHGHDVSLGSRSHLLTMKIYFLIHRRTFDDVSYVSYTEQELRTLHWTFNHPLERALEMLLRRADRRAWRP